MRVIKRSSAVVAFDRRKVERSIVSAFLACGVRVPALGIMLDGVIGKLSGELVSVEEVQNVVETVLLEGGYIEVCREYIEYRKERDLARASRLRPDAGAIADYIHMAKYARHVPLEEGGGRRETYLETVGRVRDYHIGRWPSLEREIRSAFTFVERRQVLPAMRFMQFAGPAMDAHNARGYNCSFTLVDRERVFGDIFYLLLCGCGVGFSVQWEHVLRLGKVVGFDGPVQHHVIDDSIEGWADAVKALVWGAYHGWDVEFSYHQVRDKGMPLRTSGGRAPGHKPLKTVLEAMRNILSKASGRQLRPIECHDLICHMAVGVLSGGIRRSSLISLFSVDDTEMMYCKTRGNFEPQRAMANNSAVVTNSRAIDRVIRVANDNYGEPGFYYTKNVDHGTNPCGEIGLNPVWESGGLRKTGFSFCNLCEINVAAIRDDTEWMGACNAAALIGTLQTTVDQFGYLDDWATAAIMDRDRLLGVGLTGIMDNLEFLTEGRLWFGVENIKATNAWVAEKVGVREGARLTTVKPSGTASLLLGGVGSGVHPHHARRYFRRITANPMELVAQHFRAANPHMVEVKENGDWCLVFPVEVPDTAETVKTMSGLRFLEVVRKIYAEWVLPGTVWDDDGLTHNVSATVTVDRVEDIIEYVKAHLGEFRALSFAPMVLDKLYSHAPREEVVGPADEVRWNGLVAGYRAVDWSSYREDSDGTTHVAEPACAGGTCEI